MKNNTVRPVEVLPDDLWFMLLSTVRYSFGRASYAPEYARELIHRYEDALTAGQLIQIMDEVNRELRMYESLGKTMGHEQDHKTWQTLADELKEYVT